MHRHLRYVLPALAVIFNWSLSARPQPRCDWNLLTAAEHWATDIEFTSRGERDCAKYKGCLHAVRDFTRARGLSLLEYAPDRFVTLAFPLGFERRDRPYILRGRLSRDTFEADAVEINTGDKFYYRALAKARNLQPITLEIERPVLGSRLIVVDGVAQVKLGMKHRLPLEDVVAFLNGHEPDVEILMPYLGDHGHWELDGLDERGHHLKVALEPLEDGRATLITAFRMK